MLKPNFKKDLDSYLKNRSPVAFVSDLRGQLQVSNGESPGNRYNIQLINALVMYVGTSAIQYLRTKGLTPTMSAIAHTSHMDIFQNLAVDLDTEGRYLFLNCIANQLRYPNSHTQYFSCTLLYLFAEANQESIQEQITRVLLERLIVNRPHPWGKDYVFFRFLCDFKLVHVVWDFRPWDAITKVSYFLMVQIYNLRTLEVEHDLETCQRP